MATPPAIIVDCHSHVFNAEDLPIDGFIKRISPLPSFLTGVVSLPLDEVTSWAAVGSKEEQQLLDLLSENEVAPAPTPDLGSDEAVARRLVALWPHAQMLAPAIAEEGIDTESQLARLIVAASPEQRDALNAWGAQLPVGAAGPITAEGLLDDARAHARSLIHASQHFVDALRRICRPRHEIAAELAQTYPSVVLFVPALVDFSYTARDQPATTVQRQIALHSLVSKVSVKGRLPGAPDQRVHPMVGFCPYREVENSELQTWDVNAGTPNEYIPYADPKSAINADRYSPAMAYNPDRARKLAAPDGPWDTSSLHLDEVNRAIDLVRYAIERGGFAGVKVYPPAGFMPLGNTGPFGEARGQRLDAALRTLYRYCETMQVPILTHASHSNGFETAYSDFAAPTGWEQVLKEYPNLRICFGHFGHMQGVGQDPTHPGADSWAARFAKLMDAYPNVYADVGCSDLPDNETYRNQYLVSR